MLLALRNVAGSNDAKGQGVAWNGLLLLLGSVAAHAASAPEPVATGEPDSFQAQYAPFVAVGTQQAWITGKNNTRYGYRVDSGAIKGDVRAADDNALLSEFTAIASGVDDSGIAVDESVTLAGKWRVVLFYSSGGVLTEAQSTDAQNFS